MQVMNVGNKERTVPRVLHEAAHIEAINLLTADEPMSIKKVSTP